MQIIVHQLKRLNRYLNLGLYIIIDCDRLVLMSLTNGTMIRSFASSETLDFYKYLVELDRYVSTWSVLSISEKCEARKAVTRSQILQNYKFDIYKHYNVKKYGDIYKE